MLRALFVLLLLANGLLFAWSQNWLPASLLLSPAKLAGSGEARAEVDAERVQVLTRHPVALQAAPPPPPVPMPLSAAPAATDNTPRTESRLCIEAGPFNEVEFAQVTATVKAARPALVWETLTRASPEQWSVYMGPFESEALLERKQAELEKMPKLRYEVLRVPASLAPGLSLGRYDTQAAADQALEALRQSGVRTARVVRLRRAIERQVLRVDQADSDTQVALSGLNLPRGQTFTACRF